MFRRLCRLKLGPGRSNGRVVGVDERREKRPRVYTKGRKKEEPIRRMKRRLGRWKECRRTSAGGQPFLSLSLSLSLFFSFSLLLPERFSLHPLPSRGNGEYSPPDASVLVRPVTSLPSIFRLISPGAHAPSPFLCLPSSLLPPSMPRTYLRDCGGGGGGGC